jgi:hypothetical protein
VAKVALVAGGLAAAPSAGAFACAYDDPSMASQGVLNWIYPDSLHVLGAISMAIAARELPPPNFNPAVKDLFGSQFHKTAASIARLGGAFRVASPAHSSLSFSMVLVEAVLWTRFQADPDGLRTQIHVNGPGSDDVVVVSGESVIAEIDAGRLTVGQAYGRGYLRLYGAKDRVDQFLALYKNVGETVTAEDGVAGAAWIAIEARPGPATPVPGTRLGSGE